MKAQRRYLQALTENHVKIVPSVGGYRSQAFPGADYRVVGYDADYELVIGEFL